MLTSLMIFQAILAVLMIILVLLQFGKGAEVGLMGGASDAVFSGGQRGNIFTKATVVIAVLFFGNSVMLAKMQSNRTSKSLLDNEAPVARPLNNDAMEKAAKEKAATDGQKASEQKTEETK